LVVIVKPHGSILSNNSHFKKQPVVLARSAGYNSNSRSYG
jgi:hypothetical protein